MDITRIKALCPFYRIASYSSSGIIFGFVERQYAIRMVSNDHVFFLWSGSGKISSACEVWELVSIFAGSSGYRNHVFAKRRVHQQPVTVVNVEHTDEVQPQTHTVVRRR